MSQTDFFHSYDVFLNFPEMKPYFINEARNDLPTLRHEKTTFVTKIEFLVIRMNRNNFNPDRQNKNAYGPLYGSLLSIL
jgi:hypothetical protein